MVKTSVYQRIWADRRILALLLIFTFYLVMVAGRDSWLRMPVGYVDSYWFQMCGKAWMSGLTPYVDFTDSKGPLLWLIYGIGYLISPHTLYGVCVIEMLSYWLTFYLLYRAALLVLKDAQRSLLASMLMAMVYFYPGMHFEMATEDYCQLFYALDLYILLQILYKGRYRAKYGWWLGLSCGCALMIKYSYFLTLLVPAVLIALNLILRKRHPGRFLGLFIAGVCVVTLPFLVYFLSVGALQAFFQEYFFNTGLTILEGTKIIEAGNAGLLHKWPFNIWYLYRSEHFLPEFMRLSLVALLLSVWQFRRYRYLVITMLIWYFGSLLLLSIVNQSHYYLTMAIFFFGAIIWMVDLIRGLRMDEAILSGSLVVAMLALLLTFYVYSEFYHIKVNYKTNAMLEEVSNIINAYGRQKGKAPTITFLETYDYGETIATDALPGTKYWSCQFGMTEDMRRRHHDDILIRRPDFVVVDSHYPEGCKLLEREGYRLLKVYNDERFYSWIDPNPRYLYVNQKTSTTGSIATSCGKADFPMSGR